MMQTPTTEDRPVAGESPPDGQGGTRRAATTAGFGVLLLGGWQVASGLGWLHPLIIPAPSSILAAAPHVLTAEYFWPNVRVTALEIVIGFLCGVALGFLTGLVVATSRLARLTIYPYLVALEGVPKVVLAPVFVTWFGFGMGSKIVMAIVIAFFPIFINTISGLAVVDKDRIKLMRSLTANRRQTFLKVRLPGALPSILAGIKICWTLAVIGAIVVEFLGSSAGVGHLIQSFNYQLRIPEVFVLIVLLSLTTVGVYKAIEAAERRILFWT